tara:strand:+ start:492 stop:989 length:498 start_codon:yes stop_codon:yes gene_type:complete
MDDYELIPEEDIEKLKSEVARLRKEKMSGPNAGIAVALDHLATSLDKLFKIFDVAATELERDNLHEESFEEKVRPIVDKLNDLEQQNKDIAEGMLALADLLKKKPKTEPAKPPPDMFQSPPPLSSNLPPMGGEDLSAPPPGMPPQGEMMPPPPPPDKKGFLGRFK